MFYKQRYGDEMDRPVFLSATLNKMMKYTFERDIIHVSECDR